MPPLAAGRRAVGIDGGIRGIRVDVYKVVGHFKVKAAGELLSALNIEVDQNERSPIATSQVIEYFRKLSCH